MRLFFIVFFTLYGLINIYFYLKLRLIVNFGIIAKFILMSFLILMIFSPAVIRYSERQGFETFAVYLSWIGYLWMAFIFLFFFFGLVTDFTRLLLSVLSKSFTKEFNILRLFLNIEISRKISFFFPLIISILLVTYGYFEAKHFEIEKILIKTDKITKNIKIVQISDVHIGLLIREKQVKAIVDKINEFKPDIVVSTGDLVDRQIDNIYIIATILDSLKPTWGKYAITGNHEFYADIKKSLSFIERSGFTILRNEGIYLENLNLSIIGVDDTEARRFGEVFNISEHELLAKFKDKGFILLLKHRPIIDSNSQGLFDLQLSGHTHKGQFFPFSIITGLYYPKQAGCFVSSDNCYLYISRGTGTWGPPIRIFAKPEITVIELRRD